MEFQGVAESETMQSLLTECLKYAPVNRPVLIRGERGTGKELLARFIQANSPRNDQPFVSINCAAVSEELLTAELYGHEKGAFTGADQTKIGRLEQADKGTLFLDEIGNMSVTFQQKLLRVMEYQEFERIRGTQTINVDVRIISATNANLEELMAENLFRSDLYDRLTFAELKIPALRRRKKDIPLLIVHFVKMLHEEIPNLQQKTFDRETVRMMMEYYWPGNIRELKNVVERLYLGPTGDEITPSDLPPEVSGLEITGDSFHEKVEEFKKKLITEALKDTGENQKKAADKLKMSYDQFRHYYKKFQPS